MKVCHKLIYLLIQKILFELNEKVIRDMQCLILSLLLLNIVFSNQEKINYCASSRNHPFCGFDCLSYPSSDKKIEQFIVNQKHINDMTNSLNKMRSEAKEGKLTFEFKNSPCNKFQCPFPRAFAMNEVVSYDYFSDVFFSDFPYACS